MNRRNSVTRKSIRRKKQITKLVLSLILILTFVVGGTLMYLVTKTEAVENTFEPSKVTSEIKEIFDGKEKTEIKVENTGDIPSYIRVKLVTYRVNNENKIIPGKAEISCFNLDEDNWIKADDNVYYYKKPVEPGGFTGNLINTDSEGIKLKEYDDADGGKQVIEVLAETIQTEGEDASGIKPVTIAWKVVSIDKDGNLELKKD